MLSKNFQLIKRIWKFLWFNIKECSLSNARAAETTPEVWERLLEMGGGVRKTNPPSASPGS
jgi:hypothetical protein